MILLVYVLCCFINICAILSDSSSNQHLGIFGIMDTNEDASSESSMDTHNGSDYPMTFCMPRISIFSGNSKGATEFDLWRCEVQCLKGQYSESIVLQAIR